MESITIPDNFRIIIKDFMNDLSITFPEFASMWSTWNNSDVTNEELNVLFNHWVNVFPERFFDIIYQKQCIFDESSTVNTEFLPGVDFKILFNCNDISEQTKKILWKYLQLILITIVGEIKDKQTFGDSLNLFDGIDNDQLQDKITETIGNITDFFKESEQNQNKDINNDEQSDQTPQPNKTDRLPNIQDHLQTLLDGKIGSLAKEMVGDIAEDFKDVLGDGISDMENPQDIIKKLMQNPNKISKLLKTVGLKLDEKMKNGDISKDELVKEASEMMNKMKDIGGQDQYNDLFKNISKNMGGGMEGMGGLAGMMGGMEGMGGLAGMMGGMEGMAGLAGMMGGMGKNMKTDTNAINRMTQAELTKERLRRLKDQRKLQESQSMQRITNQPNENLVDYIHPDIIAEMNTEQNTKQPISKKKKKKKK
jgi:hypothetical protein